MAERASAFLNFGRTVEISPRAAYAPRNEEELLEILRKHRGDEIRAIGRLHSWSDAPVTTGVLLDMRHFDRVQVEQIDGVCWATVGAGCQIKRLLSELQRQADATTPTLGLITEQAIAGAAATGTHGSGRQSYSHYLSEVRIAYFDSQGEPAFRTITGGPELLAARCGLGCLGVVVSVKLRCRPAYRVEEHLREYGTLNEILAAEEEYPLQQFYLIPWRWHYLGQHRRETTAERSSLASLYRWYWFLVVDLGLHLMLLLLVRILRSTRLIKIFFRWFVPLALKQNWRVVDRSQDMLVMEHELFRHIETEIFVRRPQLAAAMEFVREVLSLCSGEADALSPSSQQQLASLNLLDEALALRGRYTHHYAICIRKVLPDDTLISMASGGNEPFYAISLISYARPTEREGFFDMARLLVRSMARLFGGRPHWGKHCPLEPALVRELYPQADQFAAACRLLDSAGRFRNRWVNELFFTQPDELI